MARSYKLSEQDREALEVKRKSVIRSAAHLAREVHQYLDACGDFKEVALIIAAAFREEAQVVKSRDLGVEDVFETNQCTRIYAACETIADYIERIFP